MSAAPEDPELLAGALDVHVHAGPGLFARRFTDAEAASAAAAAGMAGFVLKAHEGSTVARAAAARTDSVEVYGGLVLNRFVGGLNPEAVELAVGLGARVVWMPTLHAANHVAHYGHGGFEEQASVLGKAAIAPVRVVGEDGRLVSGAHQVLEVLARHPRVVLSNGHLAMEETEALFEAAQARGLENLLITHPELPLMDYELDFQVRWAARGAWVERSWLPHLEAWGGVDVARTAQEILAIGPARCVLSTDLGQADNAPAPAGLAAFARALLREGLERATVRRMLTEHPRQLLGCTAE